LVQRRVGTRCQSWPITARLHGRDATRHGNRQHLRLGAAITNSQSFGSHADQLGKLAALILRAVGHQRSKFFTAVTRRVNVWIGPQQGKLVLSLSR